MPLRARLDRVIARIREVELDFLAAGIAYYAIVSVLPVVVLALVAATTIGGERLADRVLVAIGSYLSEAGRTIVADAVHDARGRAGATLLGLGVLAWSGFRVVRGLDIAFSRIYGTSTGGSLLGQLRHGAIVGLGVGAGLWAMIVLGTLLTISDAGPVGQVVSLSVLFVGLCLAFLPVYALVPAAPVTVRSVLPGVVLAAIGWILLQGAFQTYAAIASSFELYGVVGGVLLLVTWFYFGALVLLLGAVVNAVYGSPGDRQRQGDGGRDGERR